MAGHGPFQVRPMLPTLVLAAALRVGLMLYGVWQDKTMKVKYTDVDYYVFTDAAEFVAKGESPYNRATYRYSPLLAWILLPNIYWTSLFGKILFIVCDMIAGYLIYLILLQRSCSLSTSVFCAQMWLLNPLPIAVSSRGNAESIMALLVLASLYCLIRKGRYSFPLSFILYAISVHLKIYPVTYALPIYLMLDQHYTGRKCSAWLTTVVKIDVWPNLHRLCFIGLSGGTFVLLTCLCYKWYGEEFLWHTYFYHVTRRDIRHNFSPYFYMLYLTDESGYSSWLGLMVFCPQMILLILASLEYAQDLPFCCFLHTFIFVTFNKVCTSQYFLWYLCLLPLIIPSLTMTWKQAVCMLFLWFLGQSVWLTPAYYLEFEGHNTFTLLWLAGLVFFTINIWILYSIVKFYEFTPLYEDGQRVKCHEKNLPTIGEWLSSVLKSQSHKSKVY